MRKKGVLWRGALAGELDSNDGLKLEKSCFQLFILRQPSASRLQTSGKVAGWIWLGQTVKFNLSNAYHIVYLNNSWSIFASAQLRMRQLGCIQILSLAEKANTSISAFSRFDTQVLSIMEGGGREGKSISIGKPDCKPVSADCQPGEKQSSADWQKHLSRLTALTRGSTWKRQSLDCRSWTAVWKIHL